MSDYNDKNHKNKTKTKNRIIVAGVTAALTGILCFSLFGNGKSRNGIPVEGLLPTQEMQQLSSKKVYVHNGYLSAVEYPLKEESLKRAVERFRYIYDENIKGKDMKVYYAVIPDKNYFIAESAGQSVMDYDEFYSILNSEIDFMQYIDIKGLLSIEDYYKTDSHWKQESIEKVADKLANEMGVTLNCNYEQKQLETPFWGVHFRKLALPVSADTINYLDHEIFGQCKVYDYQNNKEISVYDMEKAYGKDPYELFLSGAISLLTIENPNASSQKELIVFRDSFGSSLAPLLIEGYAKITLVDIRYLRSDMLKQFITFENQDVLFIYSTLVLNNSETLK